MTLSISSFLRGTLLFLLPTSSSPASCLLPYSSFSSSSSFSFSLSLSISSYEALFRRLIVRDFSSSYLHRTRSFFNLTPFRYFVDKIDDNYNLFIYEKPRFFYRSSFFLSIIFYRYIYVFM